MLANQPYYRAFFRSCFILYMKNLFQKIAFLEESRQSKKWKIFWKNQGKMPAVPAVFRVLNRRANCHYSYAISTKNMCVYICI
jgi:hypothetical protein